MYLNAVSNSLINVEAGMQQADQLTLSQPGGAHYPHPVLCAPPDFQTLRRPWNAFQSTSSEKN